MRESHILFVSEAGEVSIIPHDRYVSIARRDVAEPTYANQTVKLADFYVEHLADGGFELDDETYSTLSFDERGFARQGVADGGPTRTSEELRQHCPSTESRWAPDKTARDKTAREVLICALTDRLRKPSAPKA